MGIPDEDTEQSNTEKSNQGLIKLSTSYKPNFNNQIDYDVLARISNDSQLKNNTSSVLGTTVQIEEITPYNINQNLSYYFTLNEKNIFVLKPKV